MFAQQPSPATLDGRTHDISSIRRLLSADRHGEIQVIHATSSTAADIRAMVEYCWHDADVVVRDDVELQAAA